MRPRFFLPLLVRLIALPVGPGLVTWWLAGPIAGAATAAALALIEIWRLDRCVRTSADDRVSFTATPPRDLTWIDEAGIRDGLADLARLGFQPIADVAYEVPGLAPGFMRVLVQRERRTYACVAQGRRGTHQPEAVTVTLFSALTDGRTLTTTSAQPDATMAFGLGVADAWQIRPDGTVDTLVVEHLATREELRAASGADVAGDGSPEHFVAACRELYRRQAQECRTNGAIRSIRRGLRWERHRAKSWVGGTVSTRLPLIAPMPRTGAAERPAPSAPAAAAPLPR